MFRKVLIAFGALSSSVMAHIKPVEHPHVGFLHTEDVLLIGAVVAVVGAGLFLFKRAVERTR